MLIIIIIVINDSFHYHQAMFFPFLVYLYKSSNMHCKYFVPYPYIFMKFQKILPLIHQQISIRTFFEKFFMFKYLFSLQKFFALLI